jgi:hypothetical protein
VKVKYESVFAVRGGSVRLLIRRSGCGPKREMRLRFTGGNRVRLTRHACDRQAALSTGFQVRSVFAQAVQTCVRNAQQGH